MTESRFLFPPAIGDRSWRDGIGERDGIGGRDGIVGRDGIGWNRWERSRVAVKIETERLGARVHRWERGFAKRREIIERERLIRKIINENNFC